MAWQAEAAESFKREQSLRQQAQAMERILSLRRLTREIRNEQQEEDYISELANAVSLILTTLSEIEADRRTAIVAPHTGNA